MVLQQSPEAQHQQTHELDYRKQISESEYDLHVCVHMLAKTD